MVSVTQAGGQGGRGNYRLTWYGAEVKARIDGAIAAAMEETDVEAKGIAQSLARVDTGEMREGIDAQVDTTGGGRWRMVLSGSSPHTIFNELGTVHMTAQPMIRPAIDQTAPKLPQRIRAAYGSGR